MTRKRILDTNKQLAEYLESSQEVFCVVTKDVLKAVIQDSAAAYNETLRLIQESNEKYSASLDALTNTLKETLDNHHLDSQALIVYQVIEAIKSKPATNQQSSEINIENQLKIRKDVTSRIVQAERLSTYYEELLTSDPPFVRHEFRTKVNKNTSESILTCKGCINHRNGYVKRCTFFKFGKKDKFSWNYTRFFSCDSKNVIYILICRTCWMFYIGETKNLKPRTRKHRSDVLHPKNTYCKKLSAHLRKCSKMIGPYFLIYPVFYVADQSRRRFIEKRFIARFRPPLNGDC